MYDAPIPFINYVFVTITAAVLAYATAMDVNDTNNAGSATDSLPSLGDFKESEPINAEPIKDEEEEEEYEEEPAPIAEAQVVPPVQTEKGGSAYGGKHNARKIKKTKRNAHNSKKRKQTRNKNHSK